MTPSEVKAYEIKTEYERTNRRILNHEAILRERASCKANNWVWMPKSFTSWENRRMVRDKTWLPPRAKMWDFACITQIELRDYIRRIKYSGPPKRY